MQVFRGRLMRRQRLSLPERWLMIRTHAATIMDIITNFILVYRLNKISIAVLFLLVSWMTWKFLQFIKDPERFVLVDKVERYTYLQESTMLLTIVVFLLVGRI